MNSNTVLLEYKSCEKLLSHLDQQHGEGDLVKFERGKISSLYLIPLHPNEDPFDDSIFYVRTSSNQILEHKELFHTIYVHLLWAKLWLLHVSVQISTSVFFYLIKIGIKVVLSLFFVM